MKRHLLIVFLLLSNGYLIAQTTRTAISNDDIDKASTWSPSGVPVGGDILNIPSGRIVDVRNPTTIAAGTGGLRINISGTLRFPTNGADKLSMPCGSVIQLYSGGVINSTGGSNSDLIDICNSTIWSSTTGPNPVNGPGYSRYPSYGFASGVLPVKFYSFEAKKNNTAIDLIWKTSSEFQNRHFIVEHSQYGLNWDELATVNPSSSTSEIKSYSYTHNSPNSGINLYRIKQVDIDDKITYSAIQAINLEKNKQLISVYPNPSNGQVYINWSTADNLSTSILKITDMGGQIVFQKIIAANNNYTSISTNQFKPGVYVITISNGTVFSKEQLLIN